LPLGAVALLSQEVGMKPAGGWRAPKPRTRTED
jgi:hypothetical protein